MNNQTSATLVLRTADFALNDTNSVGTADQYNTNWTWSNLNLRTLLGDMYNKYDQFALVPIRYQTSAATGVTFGTNPSDRTVSLNIAGLPFTNNNYNSALKTNSSNTIFGSVQIDNSAVGTSTSLLGGSMSTLTFTKNQELVNLNIYYKRLAKTGGSYDIATTAYYPDAIFIFNIYGIDKHDRVPDLNSSRIF